MGNYVDFEQDFTMRTMLLLEQYQEEVVAKKPFFEQFNYTLLLNCLLGLVVMSKEKVLSAIHTDRLTEGLKLKMGIADSELPGPEMTLRGFIKKLRHSIAHFDIEVVSTDEQNKFDFIRFKETDNQQVFASFVANEIYPFLRYYTDCLHRNLDQMRRNNA